MWMRVLSAALALALPLTAMAQTCGGVETPCETKLGTYHIGLPDDAQGAPILLFLHGYGSSG